jgi:hypothetical protein
MQVRIRVDIAHLSKNVKRERHIMPSVEDTLAQLKDAKIFTKLDANSGFWKISLTKESAPLTTFITPYGHFYFNRRPLGISSAPVHFQKRMNNVLEGLEGTVYMMDDVLVCGRNKKEHDTLLHPVLSRFETAGDTLNQEKCRFGEKSVKFIGQIVGRGEVRTGPDKVYAILHMPEPTDVGDPTVLGISQPTGKIHTIPSRID